jgi:hypothetical protein
MGRCRRTLSRRVDVLLHRQDHRLQILDFSIQIVSPGTQIRELMSSISEGLLDRHRDGDSQRGLDRFGDPIGEGISRILEADLDSGTDRWIQ